MELKEYIQIELDEMKRAVMRVADGLSQEELVWRPSPECNPIGLILFHMARSEDSFIQLRIQGKPLLWESEKWHEKLNMPASETGSHYDGAQVNAFKPPLLKDLMTYYDAVRAKTEDCLKSVTADGFDRKFTMPRFGEVTVGGIFSIVVRHVNQHIGEVSYLRGLQRGMNK
ncbi:MAG: DinB family protein [Chloroflexota bacterium]